LRRLGERARVTEGRFVFVAIGEDGRPRPVPPDQADEAEP
jgi:acyl-CoA hydrolase